MPNEYSGRPTEGGLFCEGHREAHFHMPTHKFRVGQLVQLFSAISRNVPGGTYEVTKQLPENRGEFEYRIKSVNQLHERVVRESELRGV